MELKIPRLSGNPLRIPLAMGEQLYLVGANGTGKSALLQHWVSSLGGSSVKRISAHRQTWLSSGNLEFTARSRRQFERNSKSWDKDANARWMEHSAEQRQSAVLFDIVAKDNARYRIIGQHIDDKNPAKATEVASKSSSPFRQLNELLNLATLRVALTNVNDEEILAQHTSGGQSYSIAKMSDGERAAAIMAANVLVVQSGTLLLIDEPERHLHRSIIEPFLSALFAQRQDCAFVISTHEIALPMANSTAHIAVLRSCRWSGDTAVAWDTQLLKSGVNLPEDLKQNILGSRPRILFVEGTANSLDLPLYGTLFSELSVIPRGSYEEVIRAVKGLRSSYEYHHVDAIGLIDRDDRTEAEVSELAQEGVSALDVHSVESLYYCSDAIHSVAHRQAGSLGRVSDELIAAATRNAFRAIHDDADLAERMAARRSERRLADQIMKLAPDWREIIRFGQYLQMPSTMESPYADELVRFRGFVDSEDLDSLVARYPLKESSVHDRIAQALECGSKANFERMVVARIGDDANLARQLKEYIKPLADYLDAEPPDEA